MLLVFTAILYHKGFFEPPDLSLLNDRRETSKIYDAQGNVIKEYCTYCREIAKLEELGDFPKLALAAEDKDFLTRRIAFINSDGILRALWQDIRTFGLNQGGSGIPQQTSRIIFAHEELEKEWGEKDHRSKIWLKLWRKGRETWIATRLTKNLSREQILEIYLNNVHCGTGRYGVKTCSLYYFGKQPRDLNPAEAAVIIGLWRSPRSTPFADPERALNLRNRVLSQLSHEGAIDNGELNKWLKYPLPKSREKHSENAHFAEFVRREITSKMPLVDHGLNIQTTIEPNWQVVASQALLKSMNEMKRRNPELTDLRGAAIVIDAKTGAIKVWVQEPGFKESEYLTDQIHRHPGSAFKPIAYTTLIEHGWKLSCNDEGSGPCLLDDSGKLAVPMGRKSGLHYIQNFPYKTQPRYKGMIPAIEAIAESRNAATMSAVKNVRNSRVPETQRVFKDEIVEVAERLAIPKPTVDPGLTVGLGSIDVSPLEMVRAWTGLLGNMVEPYAIEKISDRNGEVAVPKITQSTASPLDEKTSLAITRGLRATVEFPTGTAARAKRELDFQIMGKTGTATNWAGETTDNWFVGCSPSYCMAIWIGRENKTAIKTTRDKNGNETQETGGLNAIPVFITTMKTIYADREKETFPEMTDPLKPFVYIKEETK